MFAKRLPVEPVQQSPDFCPQGGQQRNLCEIDDGKVELVVGLVEFLRIVRKCCLLQCAQGFQQLRFNFLSGAFDALAKLAGRESFKRCAQFHQLSQIGFLQQNLSVRGNRVHVP